MNIGRVCISYFIDLSAGHFFDKIKERESQMMLSQIDQFILIYI